MDAHPARWAEVSIIYEGTNITKDLAPYLLNFTYTDNASDKADDIAFSIEDRERLGVSDWFPAKGDKIRVSIIVHDWEAVNQTQYLPCGTFNDSGRHSGEKRPQLIPGQLGRPIL